MQRGVEAPAAKGLVFSKRSYNAACLERLLGISLALPYIICQSMEIRVSIPGGGLPYETDGDARRKF